MNTKELLQDIAQNSTTESGKGKEIAHVIFREAETLGKIIADSEKRAAEIESRSFFKNMCTSSRKDLVKVAKAQNKINDQMFGLIQQTIALNVLSYAGLASLLNELQRCIEEGMVDTNGKVIRLSDEGKNLAVTASDIISAILDNARGTQDAISINSEQIEQIRCELESKRELDSSQDKAIDELRSLVHALSERVQILETFSQNEMSATNKLLRNLIPFGALIVSIFAAFVALS